MSEIKNKIIDLFDNAEKDNISYNNLEYILDEILIGNENHENVYLFLELLHLSSISKVIAKNNNCDYLFKAGGNSQANMVIRKEDLDTSLCSNLPLVTGQNADDGLWVQEAGECYGCMTYKSFPKLKLDNSMLQSQDLFLQGTLQMYNNITSLGQRGGGVHAIAHWASEDPWGYYNESGQWTGNNIHGAEINAEWHLETEREIFTDYSDVRYADDCGVCRFPQCGDVKFPLNWVYNPCDEIYPGEEKIPGNFRWNQEC